MNLNEIRDMLEDENIQYMAAEYATACGKAVRRAYKEASSCTFDDPLYDKCREHAVAHAVAEGANFFYRCAMGDVKRKQSQKQNRKRGKSVKEQLAGAA